MNGRGLRLQQIKIEGFKGFTGGKNIPINGKHVFILGPNGYGKSSIIEAIRWGLFGSTRRPGEVVANQIYTGDCQVELQMKQADREWILKRRLVSGTSETRPELLDKQGQPHPLSSVLPELVSVPAGEGMHIIGKAQSAPLRRMPEDISPFERTIYSSLGLTEVRSAISYFEDFIELKQKTTEKELADKVEQRKNKIESELSQVTEQRNKIIKNQPWGAGNIPTQEDTINRIEKFIKEVSAGMTLQQTPVAGLELDSLIREAETLVDRVSQAKRSDVENALHEVEKKLEQGQSLYRQLSGLTRRIGEIDSEIASTEQDLATVLAGETLEALAEAIEEIERQVDETALLLDIQKKAHAWLERQSHSERHYCPVCVGETECEELIVSLTERIQHASDREKEITKKRDALEQRYQKASRLAQQLERLKAERASLHQEWEQTKENILNFLESDVDKQDIGDTLQKRIEELENARLTLEKQLREAAEVYQEWKRKLEKLKEEVEFHRIQKRLLELEKRQRQLNDVEQSLKTLVLFGDSVRTITEALKRTLNNTLGSELPAINKRLTEAFKALTEHPAYNLVYIDESILPKLELRVASDDDPLRGHLPSQVLNGQALNALELVPYFAFSELTDLLFEVYLLLLDDPTQSFDSHHIEILVAKLAKLGERVQLVVASHEVDRFRQLLPEYFDPDNYIVVSTTRWSRQDGPTLEIYEGH